MRDEKQLLDWKNSLSWDIYCCCSVTESYPILCNFIECSRLCNFMECARLPCPSLSPEVCSNSSPLSLWCYLAISSSATLFYFCLRSFPASRSFPVSQLFASDGCRVGASSSASYVVQWLSHVHLFTTPQTASCQTSLSFTISWSLFKLCWVDNAIQPSHLLLSPSPAFNLSQNQGLFRWVSSSHQVAKVLELQHQSFQWILRVDFL